VNDELDDPEAAQDDHQPFDGWRQWRKAKLGLLPALVQVVFLPLSVEFVFETALKVRIVKFEASFEKDFR
jgi:hypothetical protein